MSKIGYIRVSTNDQNSDLQKNALMNINCEQIFEDKLSGKTTNRPGLKRALRQLKKGDTLVVWKLDRLAVLAKASNTSLEWLATGQDVSTKNAGSVLCAKRDEQSSPSPKQQQAWFEILERMTPGERESVIDRVFRHGINALLTPPQSDIQQESQFPWPEDLPAKLGVSNNSLAFAQLYASLTDEQRQRFLESINDKEHIPANHNKMSSKAG
ncbi:recombinase family protein [Photorhabdus akhurstii]|uniref:recombinase family protein n=1 Tax=Photorhabdus akhurstii TaxID=171438 RepID=UPI0026AAFE60